MHGDAVARPRPLSEQVVVVMGASSGIGRATALRFAEQGARVVVAARGEPGLRSLVAEITDSGGSASAKIADVTDAAQVHAVADHAVATYGRVDTWVQMAGVLLVAAFDDTSPAEFARVLEVNLLGQVHGAKAALPKLRQAGGTFISISSMGARRSIPLQTAYCASKHGVDGFLEALRVELQRDRVPVGVTQILPAAIDTPLFDNARTRIGVKPVAPPPAYPARIVTDAIVHAAVHPRRDIVAGGAARALLTAQAWAPSVVDVLLRRFGYELHDTGEPKSRDAPDNLDGPLTRHDTVEGSIGGVTLTGSVATWWGLRRPVTAAAAALLRPATALAHQLVPRALADAAAHAVRPTAAGARR